MKNLQIRRVPRSHRLVLVAFVVWLSPAAAQTSKTGTPDPKDAETDPVQLSPFEVNSRRDQGYLSTDTVSGNRVNGPIKNIPQPITVYNSEFLNDLVPADSMQLVDYFIGAQNNGAAANDGRYTIRGFDTVAGNQLRNGVYAMHVAVDNFSVDRVEHIQGPASVLYGNAQPGGVINTITKQAILGKRFTSVTQQFGAWDFSRSTLDANVSKGPFAFRFNALYHDNGSWQDWANKNKQFYQLAIAIRLGRSTLLKLEGEYDDQNQTISDNYLGFQNPDLWAQAFIDQKIVPRSKAGGWQGPHARTQTLSKVASATLEHTISPRWHLQATAVVQSYFHGNVLPGGSNKISQSPALGYFVQTGWLSKISDYPQQEFMVSSVYDLDVRWTKQALVLQYDYSAQQFRQAQARESIKGTTRAFNRNLQLSLGNGAAQTAYLPNAGAEWRYNSNAWEDAATNAFYASARGSYFQDRLKSLVGIRRNYYNTKVYNITHSGGIHVFRKGAPITWDDSPESYKVNSASYGQNQSWTPSAGMILSATRNVDLFVTYSTSYSVQDARRRDINNNLLPAEEGIGYEGGWRLRLLNDRLQVSTSLFTNTRKNTQERIPDAQLPKELQGTGTFYLPGVTGRADGGEIRIVGNPTPGWSLIGGYGYVDARITQSIYSPATVGQPLTPALHHSANVTTHYAFRQDWWKGFKIGGGAVFKDRVQPQADIKWKNPSGVIYHAMISYKRRFGTHDGEVQVNVRNLTDKVYLNAFRFEEPRNIMVTTRLSF
ncbi:MAG: TonB-dependent receptor [Opitutus sp.]|nr:TonB-dependent receptor [Opitutus sp.]